VYFNIVFADDTIRSSTNELSFRFILFDNAEHRYKGRCASSIRGGLARTEEQRLPRSDTGHEDGKQTNEFSAHEQLRPAAPGEPPQLQFALCCQCLQGTQAIRVRLGYKITIIIIISNYFRFL
jgi:hypothetical protein